jgi:DNA-binding Lrp family transcriptional regulator
MKNANYGKLYMVSRRQAKEHFLLLEPKDLGSADHVARTIAMCKGVNKVFLTSGEYGFVVSIDESNLEGAYNTAKRFTKSGNVGMAIAHLEYSKKR